MSQDPDTARPDSNAFRYNAALAGEIESRWQAWWDERGTYRVPNPGDEGFDESRPPYYVLDMFPYPSGAGLHVGHPEGYTATDIVSRYKRMRGFNVLHPMGFDAFGLPAEQHALRTGEHPAGFTRKTIDNFRRQLKRFGFCYDWSREFATIDEDYYRWTQWIFIQIYNAWFDTRKGKARHIDELVVELESGALRADGDRPDADAGREWSALDEDEKRAFIDNQRLAYLDQQTVNWCPALGTVLANEEVIDGRSERGAHPVLRKPLKQWLFRITAFADRLLDGLADVDWPGSTKTQQTEWIGRSEGAEIEFRLDGAENDAPLVVFTTRPDTVFGATFMVVAPEHPLVVSVLESPAEETPRAELKAYVQAAKNRSDLERQQDSKDKTGVFTGRYAINPATGTRVPIWTADYVLMGYGSGAIMAVPAHDQRDFEFAQAFGLPIRDVVYPAPMFPLWWLGTNATDEQLAGEGPDGWLRVLADFAALSNSRNARTDDELAEVLEIVQTRRDDGGDTGGPQPRGSIAGEWQSEIEGMGFESIEDFRGRMRDPQRSVRLGQAEPGIGRAINSANDGVNLNGLGTADAKARTIEWLERTGNGRMRINYKLRDWLFSRQRYWGEPFPIVFDEEGNHHAVGEDTLPVVLPALDDYHPEESEDPRPLLGKATEWVETTAGDAGVSGLEPGARVFRETNTMPGWAGSCWYHLRYADNNNSDRFISEAAERYWFGREDGGGVDLYVGGAEHAVLHLLYARFWHMVLYDLGHLTCAEPYGKLFHQGLITSFAYQRSDKSLVAIDEVEERDGRYFETATGDEVTQTTAKMSKSLRNVVNPDDIIAEFGADTFRLYEMYMGPLEASKPWNTNDIVGLFRFIQRLWRVLIDEETGELVLIESPNADVQKSLHRAIDKVGSDIEGLSFNTAIAAMIELVNTATGVGMTGEQASLFVRILAPFAPHVAEEIWRKLGNTESVALAEWPEADPSLLVDDEIEIPIQILGKVRHRMSVPAGLDQKALEETVLADADVQRLIEGKTVRKVVVVPDRLVNIVAN